MHLHWNYKTKTKEANLVIISIKLSLDQTMPNVWLIFFSFCLILGAKFTFLHYQVTAVSYLHVKIKKGFFVVGRWWKKLREIVAKGFWRKVYKIP